MKGHPCLIFLALLPAFALGQYRSNRLEVVSAKIFNSLWCGGEDIQVRLCSGQQCCILERGDFRRGSQLTWGEPEIARACRNFRLDDGPLRVDTWTEHGNEYCLARIIATFGDGSSFEINYPNQFVTTTSQRSMLQRREPLVCPEPARGLTCPAADLVAYNVRGQGYDHCFFDCPHVTQTTEGNAHTGTRCTRGNTAVNQFDFCCRSGRTATIPNCSEVRRTSNNRRQPNRDTEIIDLRSL